ncbi:MAG: hypothetical protein ACLQGV_21535 [Bryobacteraceae bacterium]
MPDGLRVATDGLKLPGVAISAFLALAAHPQLCEGVCDTKDMMALNLPYVNGNSVEEV